MAITNKQLAELLATVTVGADHRETLDAAYQTAFGRNVDDEGFEYWSDRLDNGLDAETELLEALLDGADAYVENADYPANVAVNAADKTTIVNKLEVAEAIQANTAVTAEEAATILATVTTDASKTTALDDVAAIVSGETFVLTTSATDSFIGTALNDSVTATQATYNTGDLVIDATSTDNDLFTLNTTSNITATPTVSGFENIVLNAQKAGTFSFAGTNVSGATKVTVNREDLLDGAIDGTGAVSLTDMRATNFVAGEKVSAFSVAMDATSNIATAATVDATNATGTITVSNIGFAGTTITGLVDQDFSVTGTTAKATVNVSGESSATNAVDVLTVNATDTLELTLDAIGTSATSDELILEGDADITLSIAAAAITGDKITNNATGNVTISVTGATAGSDAIDLTDVSAVTSVVLAETFAGTADTLTVNAGQLVTTKANQTGLTVLNVSGETTGAFKLAVLDNEADTAVTFGAIAIGDGTDDFDSVYLDATADELTASGLTVQDADVVLTGTETITLGTVADANSIVSSATGTVHMTVSGNTANEMLVALGAGDDNLTVTGAAAVGPATTTADIFTVQTGAGSDTLIINKAGTDSVFTTNEGDDLVTIESEAESGAFTLNTGAGNDTVTFNADATDAAHKIDLGTGDNTLKLSTTIEADTEFTLGTGSNKIMVTAAADTTDADITGNVSEINLADTLSISSAQFNEFGAFALTGTSGDALTIDASGTETTTAQTIDASVISLGYSVTSTVAITGSDYGDTITGTVGADAITLGAAGETDTINVAASDATNTDTIAVFTTAEDLLEFGGDAGTADNYVETDIDSGSGTAAAFNATVAIATAEADGLFTAATGDAAYAFIIDSTNDGNDAAVTVGYVVADLDGDGTADNVVELTGLVGGTTKASLADFNFADIA